MALTRCSPTHTSDSAPASLCHRPTTHGAPAGAGDAHCCCTLQDRTLRLWNPLKGLFIKEYRGHGYEVRDVSVCIDNSKMASVGGDRQVSG